jgi:hypothetical protein
MYSRNVLGISVAAALLLSLGGASAQQQQRPPQQPQQAQPQKPMKELILGDWTLLLVDGINADNTHTPLFGPNPDGINIFMPDGRFSVTVMRTINRPKFASNNRLMGTADENKAVTQGTLAFFGTYNVDEANKTLTLRIEASTYPNVEGQKQTWKISEITDEVMTIDLPIAQSTTPQGGFTSIETIWKKLK